MVNIRRIRVDQDGLLTQNQVGRMERIPLTRGWIDKIKADLGAIKGLTAEYAGLREFFDPVGNPLFQCSVADERTASLSRPLRGYYGIEPRCDLACTHCGPRDFHSGDAVSEDMEDAIIQQIADAGTFQVQLTGGEIAIRGFDLLKVLEKARRVGLAVMLSTNGVWKCIDRKEEFLKAIRAYDNIIQSKVSIEGTSDFHESVRGKGTYAPAVDTLARLAEYGLRPRINTTIFRSSCNGEQLRHLVSLAQRYQASLQLITLRPTGRATELAMEVPSPAQLAEYTRLATELRSSTGVTISFNFDIFRNNSQVPIFDLGRPVSCPAGLWGYHVTHNGEVYPCGFSMEIEKGRFLAGTISEETSLLDIWLNSPVFRELRQAGKSDECAVCDDYGTHCWGGCWVDAYLQTGTLSGLDPHCLREFK